MTVDTSAATSFGASHARILDRHRLRLLVRFQGSRWNVCDWLASVSLPDGGLPFALPIDDPAGKRARCGWARTVASRRCRSPRWLPHTEIRSRLPAAVVDADLQRLAALQQPDGGWPIDWAVSSPAAELEWRGYVTVRALRQLMRNRQLG